MANRMGLRTLDALSLGSAIGGSNLRRTATPVVERRPRDRGTGDLVGEVVGADRGHSPPSTRRRSA